MVIMWQKLWNLVGIRRSYCNNKQAYFFGPRCMRLCGLWMWW